MSADRPLCGEELDPPVPMRLCRDCNLDVLVASSSCRECCVWLIREDVAKVAVRDQHGACCSLREVRSCRPRSPEEIIEVLRARSLPPLYQNHGWREAVAKAAGLPVERAS